MTTEIDQTGSYAAVLADLRSKRAKIDNTIRVLEELSGLKLEHVEGELKLVPRDQEAAPAIEETAGMFLGMSIVDASKKLLALRKRTMGNVEIAKELREGGLVLTGTDPVNVVGSVLTRRFNQVGDVVKVGRGIWGLKEWYPGRNFRPNTKVAVQVLPSVADHHQDPAENRPGDETHHENGALD
jgi:hypothetical protein